MGRHSKDFYLKVYRFMKIFREIERILRLEARGFINPDGKSRIYGGTLTAMGQEAISVGAALATKQQDWTAFDHRSLGGYLVRGISVFEIFMQYLQKAESTMGGYDGNIHLEDLDRHVLHFVSDMMAHAPVANGVMAAHRYLKDVLKKEMEPAAALVIAGNGASSQGLFHGVLNDASVNRLPVVFVINDNQFAISPDVDQPQKAVNHIALRGIGYGMPIEVVDGNDVLLIYNAVYSALERARNGGGPSLIECKTRRQGGHNDTQDMGYTFEVLPEWCEWVGRDPLLRFRALLFCMPSVESAKQLFIQRKTIDQIYEGAERLITAEDLDRIDREIAEFVREEFERALAARDPEPKTNGFRKSLPPLTTVEESRIAVPASGKKLTIARAIQQAYAQAMRENPLIRHLGEDVGYLGGVHGITKPLYEEFGKERVCGFQLDEPSLVGNAIGQALQGVIPVIEFQFLPFFRTAWSQIVSMLAHAYFHTETRLQVIMRAPCGGGFSGGDFHSNMPEAEFIHEHGIAVVFPSTPYDAKGLVLTALREKMPILFLEQIKSYHDLKLAEQIPEEQYFIPFGKARIVKEGSDLSIITYGPLMLHYTVMPAVEELERKGVSVEVIDLRCLHPLDRETLENSVGKTGNFLVVHEASKTCGYGESVACKLFERFYAVRGGVLAALDTPLPSHPNLESFRTPSVQDVISSSLNILREGGGSRV